MIGEVHLCEVLNRNEIDIAFIDHSLSYRENKSNLHKQFGIKFAKTNYARDYERYSIQASQVAKIIRAEEPEIKAMLANMRPKGHVAPATAPQKAEPLSLQIPFDPLERAAWMESQIMRGSERKYYRFRYQAKWWAPSVADSSGCCIQCAYCWNASRNRELPGEYRSPEYVAARLKAMSREHKGSDRAFYMRTGGCEPILGEASLEHFVKILELCDCDRFLLETNGIMLGYHPEFFELLEPFKKQLWVRVCAKADNPKTFQLITCAKSEYFDRPFKAIHEAGDRGFLCSLAYMPEYTDMAKLRQISKWEGDYDFEHLTLYPGVAARLRERGCLEIKKNRSPQPVFHPTKEDAKSQISGLGYDFVT